VRYEFHPDALAEYEEAARYYANRQVGLELRFMQAIEDTVQRIIEAPERWRILEDDIRWCLSRVFPYAVLYTVEHDYVLIVAIMHCNREPSYWHQRLQNPN
jgi:plasmid stabilization system protein ParE